jgi:hypothetical protein
VDGAPEATSNRSPQPLTNPTNPTGPNPDQPYRAVTSPTPTPRQGVGPTAGRATVLAAAELASYDEAKGMLSSTFGMRGVLSP